MRDLKKLSYAMLGVSNVLYFLFLFFHVSVLACIAILAWAAALVLLALGDRKENKRLGVIDWVYLILALVLLVVVIWLIVASPL